MTNIVTRLLQLPMVASEHGSAIDNLLWYVHLLMALLFVGWTIYFIYVLFRFNNKRNPKANYHGVKNHSSSYIEVAVAVVEVVLLLGFAIPIWANTVEKMPDDPNALEIDVAGRQFNWVARYPGPDGKLGAKNKLLVTADNPFGVIAGDPNAKDDIENVVNDIVVPIDRNVIIHLTSFDVIHSFAVKPMRVTQDAIPGMTIPLWFKAIREGKFMIQCAQLCGNGHYAMRGNFNVLSKEKFAQWVADRAVVPAEEGSEEDGESQFE